jgi:hypothetical protein
MFEKRGHSILIGWPLSFAVTQLLIYFKMVYYILSFHANSEYVV